MAEMYSVCATESILRELSREGHSLRSSRIDDKRLIYSAIKHFGSWKNAIRDLGLVQGPRKDSVYCKTDARRLADIAKVKWTDKNIYDSLRPLIEKGMSPKEIQATDSALYSAAYKRFGGIKKFCEEYRLTFTSGRAVKYTKDDIDTFVKRVTQEYANSSSNWLRNSGSDDDARFCHAASKLYGTWNKALEANGVSPACRIRKIVDKDDLLARFRDDIASGKKRHEITYYLSVIKYFGSFDALDEYLGIDTRTQPKPECTVYVKSEIDVKITEILRTCTEDRITAEYLDAIDVNIAYSIREQYGSMIDYFSGLDIDFYTKPYVPFRWTPDNTKRQLLRWVSAGVPVNYTGVAQRNDGIIGAARKYFGGWGQLFEACGLNYDDYRVDTDMASYYGREFEAVLGEILTDSGMTYTKYETDTKCHPDFVIGDHWIDAKLSEWTIHTPDSGTIRKYEPNCAALTIVFLRGDRDCDRKLSEKTRLVNVYYFVDALPDDRKRYYYEKLDAIERSLIAA